MNKREYEMAVDQAAVKPKKENKWVTFYTTHQKKHPEMTMKQISELYNATKKSGGSRSGGAKSGGAIVGGSRSGGAKSGGAIVGGAVRVKLEKIVDAINKLIEK